MVGFFPSQPNFGGWGWGVWGVVSSLRGRGGCKFLVDLKLALF